MLVRIAQSVYQKATGIGFKHTYNYVIKLSFPSHWERFFVPSMSMSIAKLHLENECVLTPVCCATHW
jgi:hypothetical protein